VLKRFVLKLDLITSTFIAYPFLSRSTVFFSCSKKWANFKVRIISGVAGISWRVLLNRIDNELVSPIMNHPVRNRYG